MLDLFISSGFLVALIILAIILYAISKREYERDKMEGVDGQKR